MSAIADAMLHDAWLNHVGSQKEGGTASAAASNVAVYDNAAIGRLSEVSAYCSSVVGPGIRRGGLPHPFP